jgi:D-alanyl-D-alanine carboxypeptidase/D-alanyl-D-alanine-endopeptidase (penicillin-binding protein 4)
MRLAAFPRRAGPAFRRVLAVLGVLGAAAVARPGLSEPPPAIASAVPATASAAPATGAPATAALDATKVRAAVRDLASDAKGWGGTAGATVVELAGGTVLASVDEHTAMNPASNAKLATAASALRLLGAEHRFLTAVYGKINGDRVAALVLRGFGDPTLTADDLAALARELQARGVRKVGEILVDQSYFDDVYTPPAFTQQPNEWAPFRAPVSAIAVNANTVGITARPAEAGKPALVTLDPPGIAKVQGTVRTTKKGDPEKLGVSITAAAGAITIKVSGSVPEGGDPARAWKRLDDPRLAPGFVLRAALLSAGIEAGGDVRLGGEKEKTLLAAHRSDTLAHVLARLGKDSDNFVAETVFKTLSAEKKTRPATFAASAELVTAELRAMGAFEPGVAVTNGSGLFDANRTTAATTAALLRSTYADSKSGPEFVASLAIGGVDGTLRSRFKPWAKLRAVRAKTGTLNASFALSGYVLGPPGKPAVAFALFVNGAPGKAGPARASLDRVVDAIARAQWGSPP